MVLKDTDMSSNTSKIAMHHMWKQSFWNTKLLMLKAKQTCGRVKTSIGKKLTSSAIETHCKSNYDH